MSSQRIIRGIWHTGLARVLLLGIQILTTTILARTLTPQDYGLVGFASIIITFLGRFNSLGMVNALIRIPDASSATRNTAATLNLILSVGMFLLAMVGAPLASYFSDAAETPRIIRVLAFSFLLSPLAFLPTAQLTREMSFDRLRTPGVVGAAVRGILAIVLALSGFKYWSLIAGTLCGTSVTNALLTFNRPIGFRLEINRREANRILSFGLPATLTGLVTFALMNSDNMVIGSMLGSAQLGFYSIALTWGTFGSTLLYETIHTVLFPHFAGIQSDRAKMKEHFLLSTRIIGLLAVLGNLALFGGIHQFLIGVLGGGTPRWTESIAPLQVLLIYGTIRAITEPLANPLMALGKAKLMLKANAGAALIQIPALPWVASHGGITGVAWLITGCYLLQWFVYVPFLRRELGITLREYGAALYPLLVTAIVAGLAGPFFSRGLPDTIPGFLGAALITTAIVVPIHELLTKGGGTALLTDLLRRRRQPA